MIVVHKYRLYETRKQRREFNRIVGCLRYLYNACLQERRDGYRAGVKITARTQEQAIPIFKNDPECPDYKDVHSHFLQDAVTRMEHSFDNFFERVKENKVRVAAGQKPKPAGYPRFKGRNRYNTFSSKDPERAIMLREDGKHIFVHGMGEVKIVLHRPIEGQVRRIAITGDGDGHLYALVTIKREPKYLTDPEYMHENVHEGGVDLGLKNFLACDDGTMVANPRPMREARIAVERGSRKVSRRKPKSKRQQKARRELAQAHAKVANVRRDFHHKTARELVRKYGRIAIEDLNIAGLCRGWLAKHIYDAAWGQFVTILTGKAADAGRVLVRVDPYRSSQECRKCGGDVPKTLDVRIHDCPHCYYVADRDVNSAGIVWFRAFGPPDALRPGRGRRGGERQAADPNDPRSLRLTR